MDSIIEKMLDIKERVDFKPVEFLEKADPKCRESPDEMNFSFLVRMRMYSKDAFRAYVDGSFIIG